MGTRASHVRPPPPPQCTPHLSSPPRRACAASDSLLQCGRQTSMHSLCTHYPLAPLTGELQQSFDMQLFVTKQSGGVGVDNSLAESAMALLSTFSVNSHVSMTVMGIIPTIKSSEVCGMPCGGVSATFTRPRWLKPHLTSLSERPNLSFSSRVARLQWPQKQQQTRDVLHACSSGLSPPPPLPSLPHARYGTRCRPLRTRTR